MLGMLGYGAGAILSGFMLLTILWAVSLVVIWNDADETYGTGFFWALAVIVAPVVAIPAYWLMRLGTHRNWREDLAACERLEHRKALGARLSGMALDIDRQLGKTGAEQSMSQPAGGPRAKFTPFTPTFAGQAEEWRRRIAAGKPGEVAGEAETQPTSIPIQSQRELSAGVLQSTDRNASSQGCGDSAGSCKTHERLSWRYRNLAVESRWDTSRNGGAVDAARRRVPQ